MDEERVAYDIICSGQRMDDGKFMLCLTMTGFEDSEELERAGMWLVDQIKDYAVSKGAKVEDEGRGRPQ